MRLLTGLERDSESNVHALCRGEREKAAREELGPPPPSVFRDGCLAVPAEPGLHRICNLLRDHPGPHDWEPRIP